MGVREKMHARVAPMLPPGEQARQVFMGQTGPTPWLAGAIGAIIYMFFAKYRVVAITPQAMHVFESGAFSPAKPKRLLASLPRQPIGPLKGIWGKAQIGPERMWVNKRFHKDVVAADSELYGGPMAGAAQPGYASAQPSYPQSQPSYAQPPAGMPTAAAQPGATEPGWFPDPSGQGGQRWWDGTQWTDHRSA